MSAVGTAPNKEAAVGTPSDLSTFMNIATHNVEAFTEGDELRVCSEGGIYHDSLYVPSAGIIYKGDGDTRPIITGDDVRDHCVVFRDKSNLTVQDIIAEHAKLQCIFGAANQTDVSDLQFIDVECRFAGTTGLILFTENPNRSISDVLYDGVVAGNNRHTGISNALHGGGNILHRHCGAYSNAVNAPDDPDFMYTAGLYAISLDPNNRLRNVVWDECWSLGNGIGAVRAEAGHGIWFDMAGPHAEIRRSTSIGNRKSGVYMEAGGDSPGIKMYSNVVANNEVGVLLSRGSRGVQIFDNRAFANYVGLQVSGQWGGGDPVGMVGNAIRRNTILNSTLRALVAAYGGETGNIYEDNIFGPESPGFIEYGKDVLYDTVADWEASVGRVEGNRS